MIFKMGQLCHFFILNILGISRHILTYVFIDSIHVMPLHIACTGKKIIFDFKLNLENET